MGFSLGWQGAKLLPKWPVSVSLDGYFLTIIRSLSWTVHWFGEFIPRFRIAEMRAMAWRPCWLRAGVRNPVRKGQGPRSKRPPPRNLLPRWPFLSEPSQGFPTQQIRATSAALIYDGHVAPCAHGTLHDRNSACRWRGRPGLGRLHGVCWLERPLAELFRGGSGCLSRNCDRPRGSPTNLHRPSYAVAASLCARSRARVSSILC